MLRTDDEGIADVFRSNVTPGDPVASILGYQSAGVNSSENVGANMAESFLKTLSVIGFGNDPSPHSYYPCIIGCGEDNYTPDKDNFYTPNKYDIDGSLQSPIENYYIDNFAERDAKGNIKRDINNNPIMTINMDLLSSENKPTNQTTTNTNSATTIDLKNINGGQ